MVHFHGTDYREHTSCVSEAQKYQGKLYKPKEAKAGKGDGYGGAVVAGKTPRKAYVEDAPETPEIGVGAWPVSAETRNGQERKKEEHAVPPRAPTPPPAVAVNVFDYLVTEEAGPVKEYLSALPDSQGRRVDAKQARTANSSAARTHGSESQPQKSRSSNSQKQSGRGYAVEYGSAPVQASHERYDSAHAFPPLHNAFVAPPLHPDPAELAAFKTPGAVSTSKGGISRTTNGEQDRKSGEVEVSGKKRKRGNVEGLDLSRIERDGRKERHGRRDRGDDEMPDVGPHSAMSSEKQTPVLHSGLTGGLNRLLKFPPPPEYYYADDPIGGEEDVQGGVTPGMALKKSRHDGQETYQGNAKRESSSSTRHTDRTGQQHGERYREDKPSEEREHRRRKHRHRRRERSPSPVRGEDQPISRMRRSEALKCDTGNPSTAVVHTRDRERNGQVVQYSSRAAHFLSLVTKGPDSERGMSVNKVLKRYHRGVLGDGRADEEKRVRGRSVQEQEDRKEEEERELWRSLRLKTNEKGEIVLVL